MPGVHPDHINNALADGRHLGLPFGIVEVDKNYSCPVTECGQRSLNQRIAPYCPTHNIHMEAE